VQLEETVVQELQRLASSHQVREVDRKLETSSSQTIKLVFAASLLSNQYLGVRAKTGWLRILL
jgi:hypothetical protein